MNDLDQATRITFGLFEADLRSGELWKAGRKIKLQSQPFKLLNVLIENPGEVVTREELYVRLWGTGTVGDFDRSLGTAINKIRDALGDTADNPRFVETLARRGYRWIAPVSVLRQGSDLRVRGPDVLVKVDVAEKSTAQTPEAADKVATGSTISKPVEVGPWAVVPEEIEEPKPVIAPRRENRWLRRKTLAAVTAFASLLLAGLMLWLWLSPMFTAAPLRRMDQVTRMGRIAPGTLAMENLPAGVTDGLRLYMPVLVAGRSILNEVNVLTGAVQPISVPNEIASPTLGDLSPDGSTMLLRSHLSPESEQPFWLVPTSGGSALRLADIMGHDATWMPDGKSVLLASGNQLIVKRLGDGVSTPLARLPGRAFWLRWSPDGTLLRFTLTDPIGHTSRLAELRRDGSGLRLLLDHWSEPASECCGVWTGDGRHFVFQSVHSNTSGASDLWQLRGNSDSKPTRITDGPMSYVAPISSRSDERIYFLGVETQSALQEFDIARHEYEAAPSFLADAARVEYSRDHQWVTWTDQSGRQWRAHADGSDVIRLTPDSMQVFLGRWSPDGHRIAMMARDPGKAWRIYLVEADGGAPEALLNENRNEADPSWSQDGKQIVFGRITDVMGKEEDLRELEIVDLQTRTLTPVPGSAGTFSPRWSPDGSSIAALSLDQRRLVLFNRKTKSWRTLADTTAADPVWSSDGKALFFHASLAELQPIYRMTVADGSMQRVAIFSSPTATTADSFFYGLTPDNFPIVRTRTATGNLYSIDLGDHKR